MFKEHWEIAKCKLHPLFGFMCTLDPLGYAYSQYVSLAFLVLHRAIEMNIENPTEANTQALELIQETCAQMVAKNPQLKAEIIDKALAFAKHAENRTVDAVPAVNVLVMQLLSWNELSEEEKLNVS